MRKMTQITGINTLEYRTLVLVPVLLFTAHTTPAATSSLASVLGGEWQQCNACIATSEHSGEFFYAPTEDWTVTGTSEGTAWARGVHGVLKAYIQNDVVLTSANQAGGGIGSIAEATFSDSFTISSPGKSGQTGQLTLGADFNWDLSQERATQFSEAYASFGLSASSTIQQAVSVFTTETINSNGTGERSLFTTDQSLSRTASGYATSLTINFVFDQPISFSAYLYTAVGGQAFAQESWSFTVDAASSAYWSGIISVVDSEGNRTANYSLTSGSGTDWTQAFSASPVPEMNTRIQALLGLCILPVLLGYRSRFNRTETASSPPRRARTDV